MNNNYDNNPDFDIVGEKFFYPHLYLNANNYTLNKAFAISNEQLPDVFKNLNLKGKKMLTVGASGDQALNAILKGSKDITIIDGNIYARAFVEYKLAVIKTFNFETFNDLFVKPRMFNWKVYAKISHLLSPQTRNFWDSFMLEQNEDYSNFPSEKSITNKMLLFDHRDRYSLFYKNEKVYNKLQQLLNANDISFKFINAEFKEFPEALKEKYDYIFLSNIHYYVSKEEFESVVDKLYNYKLNNAGKMVVNYGFDSTKEEAPKTIKNHKIETQEVTRWRDGENITDTLWIISKDKKIKKETDLSK